MVICVQNFEHYYESTQPIINELGVGQKFDKSRETDVISTQPTKLFF